MQVNSKDMTSGYRTLSGVCNNLAAGWFGLVLIAPKADLFADVTYIFSLIWSVLLGILFMWLSFMLDRKI